MQERRRALERRAVATTFLVILQALATIFFIADVAGDLAQDGWSMHLLVETGATVALLAGVVFGALQLRWLILRARLDETAVATARGAMSESHSRKSARVLSETRSVLLRTTRSASAS